MNKRNIQILTSFTLKNTSFLPHKLLFILFLKKKYFEHFIFDIHLEKTLYVCEQEVENLVAWKRLNLGYQPSMKE